MISKNSNSYIYVYHIYLEYEKNNVVKIGRTEDLYQRQNGYITSSTKRGKYLDVYEVSSDIVEKLEKNIAIDFKNYNFYIDSGTEFYNKEIVHKLEPYFKNNLIDFRKFTQNEIEDIHKLIELNYNQDRAEREKQLENYKFKREQLRPLRHYQEDIINNAKLYLISDNKVYINLPTGTGKTLTTFHILKYLNSDIILNCSPRNIVKWQNSSEKYCNILSEYSIFNYDTKKNLELFLTCPNKKILFCCTQSLDNLEHIFKNLDKNICVWFDEAHWGLEKNIKKYDFWLKSEKINHRIFTSASPDINIVTQNKTIFGKILSKDTKYFIDNNWLSSLTPLVYLENKDNPDKVKFIISDFKQRCCNWGFCFHSSRDNAYSLYLKHLRAFEKNSTEIKPFLLIDNKDGKYNHIDKNDMDIQKFQSRHNSLGYLVQMYSMGYDFCPIDYICFPDPKTSYADIIQSIGRGIRPDGLGLMGRNLNKKLFISLPIYVDDKEKGDYNDIISTLDYLIYNIKLNWSEIKFQDRRHGLEKQQISDQQDKYQGEEDMKSTILNLIEWRKRQSCRLTYSQAKNINRENKLTTKQDYCKLSQIDQRLPEHPEEYFKQEFTNWIDYLNIERKYYDLETCKNKVGEYLKINPDYKQYYLQLQELCKKICQLDCNFPPSDLWIEYYSIKQLSEIITYPQNKKKSGVVI